MVTFTDSNKLDDGKLERDKVNHWQLLFNAIESGIAAKNLNDVR